MDGVHDLGGLDGFGPVEREESEPLFDQDWERRVFRLMLGSLGALGGPGGRFRHSIERMEPAHYLSSPHYEHWLTGVTTMAVNRALPPQTSSTAAPAAASRCPPPTAVCCRTT